jgi:hypothetical protein
MDPETEFCLNYVQVLDVVVRMSFLQTKSKLVQLDLCCQGHPHQSQSATPAMYPVTDESLFFQVSTVCTQGLNPLYVYGLTQPT